MTANKFRICSESLGGDSIGTQNNRATHTRKMAKEEAETAIHIIRNRNVAARDDTVISTGSPQSGHRICSVAESCVGLVNDSE